MENDREQIKLLAIFHYIVGGITALFSCFPFIHIILGIAMVAGAFDGNSTGESPPRFLGWFFIAGPALIVLCGWAFSACVIIAGWKLSHFRNGMFCLVIAGIECAFIPYGTVLGVFTIIVLMRESVKDLFSAHNAVTQPQ